MEIMDKGLIHSAKFGADSSAQNTTNTQKLIRPICPIGPKLWDIVKKKASSGIRNPCKR